MITCRLCGKDALACGGWLERINKPGDEPGLWECRPDCREWLPGDIKVIRAIEHWAKQRKMKEGA